MRTLQDLKGRHIQFEAPDTWVGGGTRTEKVVKVDGKMLTVEAASGRKGRIHIESVRGVIWFNKLRELAEWLEG